MHAWIPGTRTQPGGADRGGPPHNNNPQHPAAAGPHYNVSGTTPPLVSDQTEVWLDFTAATDGTGAADTTVPFLPTPGTRSVVIHAEATAPNGTAGPRLVCLPVAW